MNPFASKNIEQSIEMKSLFRGMEELIAQICLLHCEETGEKADITLVQGVLNSVVDFRCIHFRAAAFHKLNTQPKGNLPVSEKIAIAAHEAYKMVTRTHVKDGKVE